MNTKNKICSFYIISLHFATLITKCNPPTSSITTTTTTAAIIPTETSTTTLSTISTLTSSTTYTTVFSTTTTLTTVFSTTTTNTTVFSTTSTVTTVLTTTTTTTTITTVTTSLTTVYTTTTITTVFSTITTLTTMTTMTTVFSSTTASTITTVYSTTSSITFTSVTTVLSTTTAYTGSTSSTTIGQADLIVESITITDSTVAKNGFLTAIIVIKNVGGAATSTFGFNNRYTFSPTQDTNEGDDTNIKLHTFPFGETLSPGDSTSYTTFLCDTGTATGAYYLYYYVDNTNSIIESNNGNNQSVSSTSFTVVNITTYPDFQPSIISFSDGTTGDNYSIQVDIFNNGTTYLGDLSYRLYLDNNTDATYQFVEAIFTGFGFDNISGPFNNGSNIRIVSGTMPNFPGAGKDLRLYIDSFNTVAESNESNNRDNKTISVALGSPDLIISAINFLGSPAYWDGTAPIEIKVQNIGITGAGNSQIRITALSQDATNGTSADDAFAIPINIDFSVFDVGSVAAGQEVTVFTSINLMQDPSNGANTNYYVVANADNNGEIAESNEGNNLSISSSTILFEFSVDIIVDSASNVEATVSKTIPGNIMNVNVTLKNIGTGFSSGFPFNANGATVYISTDATTDTPGDDEYFGELVPFGASISAGGTLLLPIACNANTIASAPNFYYLYVVADIGLGGIDLHKETDETNNRYLIPGGPIIIFP